MKNWRIGKQHSGAQDQERAADSTHHRGGRWIEEMHSSRIERGASTGMRSPLHNRISNSSYTICHERSRTSVPSRTQSHQSFTCAIAAMFHLAHFGVSTNTAVL